MRNDYEYPESMSDVVWVEDGIQYSIFKHDLGHYCGYCRFENRPVLEQGYASILTYVPVHGGITLARQDKDGTMVYGFDCAHCDDERNEQLRDISWLKDECRRMAFGIKIAAKYEVNYLESIDDKEKADILDSYHKELESNGIQFAVTDNFGAMINVLFGSL